MTKALKKQTTDFYLAISSFVLIVIALVIYIFNATGAYYNDLNSGIIRNSSITLLLLVTYSLVLNFSNRQWVNDILLAIAVIFLCIVITTAIGTRVESMGWIIFSDLESGNATAKSALNQFFVSWVFYLLGLIALLIAGFTKRTKHI